MTKYFFKSLWDIFKFIAYIIFLCGMCFIGAAIFMWLKWWSLAVIAAGAILMIAWERARIDYEVDRKMLEDMLDEKNRELRETILDAEAYKKDRGEVFNKTQDLRQTYMGLIVTYEKEFKRDNIYEHYKGCYNNAMDWFAGKEW